MNRRLRAQRRPIPAPIIGASSTGMARSGDPVQAPYAHHLVQGIIRLPHPRSAAQNILIRYLDDHRAAMDRAAFDLPPQENDK